jgi:DNA mismatch repair protein MutL
VAGIAAGEVIDRPATVIKELIENSLDAGATDIEIELEQAGLKKLLVRDNGIGMDQTDLQLAPQRHATSKLVELPDLQSLRTFGFRGEALASIAAVAELTIQSRPANQTNGWQVSWQPGTDTPSELQPVPMAPGTTIIVQDLFAQLPARLKFMKNPATELRHILQMVSQAALMHPQVRFQVTHQRKQLQVVPAPQQWEDRVATVLGSTTSRHLWPVNQDYHTLKITGFIGQPGSNRKHHGQQFVFINRRPVHSSAITTRIKQAYGRLLAAAADPVFLLHLELHPQLVDVNVHPRKEEVRFMDTAQVLNLVEDAIAMSLAALAETMPTAQLLAPQPNMPALPLSASAPPASRLTTQWLKTHRPEWRLTGDTGPTETNPEMPAPDTATTEILQLDNTYLIMTMETGLLLIDQHAAHESIIFDQLQQLYQHQTPPAPVTLSPAQVIELGLPEALVLTEQLETLRGIGLELEPFGPSSFKIISLPGQWADRQPTTLVLELLDELKTGRPVPNVDDWGERTLAYLACRQAVKAGDYLTPEQRLELVTAVAEHPDQWTCPHGRPVASFIPTNEVAKRFGR